MNANKTLQTEPDDKGRFVKDMHQVVKQGGQTRALETELSPGLFSLQNLGPGQTASCIIQSGPFTQIASQVK